MSVTSPIDRPILLQSQEPRVTHWPQGIQRCFYLYGVPNTAQRGCHRHQQCQMALCAAAGSLKVYVQLPGWEAVYHLTDSRQWLHLPPAAWRMMYDFSPGTVLTVLASEAYSTEDYISQPYFSLHTSSVLGNKRSRSMLPIGLAALTEPLA